MDLEPCKGKLYDTRRNCSVPKDRDTPRFGISGTVQVGPVKMLDDVR